MSSGLVIAGAVLAALLAAFVLVGKKGRKATASTVVVVTEGAAQYIARASGETINTASPLKQTKAQRRRRAAAVSGYVGFNGSAKSSTMVRDTLPDLAAGRPVLSTVALLSPDEAADEDEAAAAWDRIGATACRPDNRPLALPHPLWVPLTSWDQMRDFDGRATGGAVILMDEVTGLADSADHATLPTDIRDLFNQLRRREVIVRWTTLDWANANVRLRRATQVVHFCKGLSPYFVDGSPWPRKRLTWIRTYDATDFTNFTEARQRTQTDKRPRRICAELVRIKGPKMRNALRSYDSWAPVLGLGEEGDCGHCGLQQRKRYCRCA